MSVSEVDLANLALGLLFRDTIRSLDGREPGAVLTKQFMRSAIEEVIEEFDWPQCRVVKTLTPVVSANLRGWTHSYIIPSDAVCVWNITDLSSKTITKYELGMSESLDSDETLIFANQSGLTIRYGSRRASLSRFTPQTINLMAIKLAMKCTTLAPKDKGWFKNLGDSYKLQLSALKTRVANMEPEITDTEFVPETISVRSA